MGKPLGELTVAELDAVADQHQVADYPSDGLKADKLEALTAVFGEAFEAELEEIVTYRLTLVDDVNGAQFNLGGEEISLDTDNPVFETTHQPTFVDLLRTHPFLVEADA